MFVCFLTLITSVIQPAEIYTERYFIIIDNYFKHPLLRMGFPGGSDGRESPCSVEEPCLIPGSGRSPREGNGYPLQYSCLDNSMDRGAWKALLLRAHHYAPIIKCYTV